MTPSVWDLLITIDMSTHKGAPYLVVRIRLCWQVDNLNLHLVSIPVFDSHTGENMFNVSAKFFECICQEWKKIPVGIATDVTRSMTGRIQDLVTRFEQGVFPGLMRFRCGGHQLDLLKQDFFKNVWMRISDQR